MTKKKCKNPPHVSDQLSYLENLLKRNGSLDGLDAYNELIHLGCCRKILGGLLVNFGDRNGIILNPTTHSKGRRISTRPLDSFDTAFHPFKAISMRDLGELAKRTQKFLKEVELLKQSPIVQELIKRGLIRDGDILAGPPLLFTGPFLSLLSLPELIKKLDLRRNPDQTRLRIQIHWHIFDNTGD